MKTQKKKQKSTPKGAGRLYKRLGGKDYPPDSPIKAAFYLAIVKDGRRVSIALKDESGAPITDRKQAEQERDRLTLPTRAADEVQRVETLAAIVQGAQQRLEQAIEEGEPTLTIAEAWDAYLKALKYDGRTLGERTEYTYQRNWMEFVGWMRERHPESQTMRGITEKHAKAFCAYLVDKGESAKTFNNKIGVMKTVCSVICKEARMQGNPFRDITPHPKQTRSKRALTVDELKRLIDAAHGEYKTLFIIGTFTGLRLYDCATLKWNEIDLDRGLIMRMPHKTARSTGKVVTIGIPAFMAAHLEQAPPEQRKGFLMPQIAELYTNGRPMAVSRQIRAIFEAAGIERTRHEAGRTRAAFEEGFHALRHSFVSLCAERGANMATIQQLVGHSNPAMTAYYTHTTEQAALNAARLLELDTTTTPRREPLPAWARELIEGLNGRNWKAIRAEILEVAQ